MKTQWSLPGSETLGGSFGFWSPKATRRARSGNPRTGEKESSKQKKQHGACDLTPQNFLYGEKRRNTRQTARPSRHGVSATGRHWLRRGWPRKGGRGVTVAIPARAQGCDEAGRSLDLRRTPGGQKREPAAGKRGANARAGSFQQSEGPSQ
jgi:hypothetical protein